ncbi:class I SAM-dependent methyltransferase [Nisaea nitritireducens]|uniref:class I SAM-dependent methyltransferase n=1 Tax=Nisaea nitritireducens TaxID=568392 RepID=UPI0018693F0A|nr:class I SAM-dependent methyltransferase [Nisaea nitritireducens]
MTSVSCHHCDSARLETVEGYSDWCRVTSDSRSWTKGGALAVCGACGLVQKPITDEWSREADRIYESYVLYHQSRSGVEQLIAGETGLKSRSVHLIDWMRGALKLDDDGLLLDFGCGTGSTLKAFAQELPRWRLNGYDPNVKDVNVLSEIETVDGIYERLEDIDKHFDLVTLVHVFEHIPSPAKVIRDIRRLLHPTKGRLFIQVPYFPHNPFDLLIADHSSHFTQASIASVVASAGFDIEALRVDVLKREITVVARPGAGNWRASSVDAGATVCGLRAALDWLGTVRKSMETCGDGAFGIFGTSISAAWASSNLERRADFYLDEDRSRVGCTFFDRPIAAPSDAQRGASIYIPLVPALAAQISERLTGFEAVAIPGDFPEAFTRIGTDDAHASLG